MSPAREMRPDRRQLLYMWLAALFIAALLTADLIGGKLFHVGSVHLSAGMLAFPLTFVLTDVLNEFYGPTGARLVTYLGFGATLFAFAIINVALVVPTSPESMLSEAVFSKAFGLSGRLIVVSLTAYVIGQVLDIFLFAYLRRMTGHRFLWLRATGSTVVSQMVDTFVVTFGFMIGLKPVGFIFTVVRDSYLLKLAIALGLTPLIYAIHALVLRLIKIHEAPDKAFEPHRS
jgi:queuosine precursor transporter